MTLIGPLNVPLDFTEEAGGGRSYIEQYRSDLLATQVLTLEPLPDLGAEPFLGDFQGKGLKVDARIVRPQGSGSIINVLYSNDARWRALENRLDDLAIGFGSLTVASKEVIQDLSVFVATEKVITKEMEIEDPDDPEKKITVTVPVSIWFWEATQSALIKGLEEIRTVATYRTSFATGLDVTISVEQWLFFFQQFTQRSGEIHSFGDVGKKKRYAFRPRLFDQQKKDKWRVEYNWTFDPGTINTLNTEWIVYNVVARRGTPGTGFLIVYNTTTDADGTVHLGPTMAIACADITDIDNVMIRLPYTTTATIPRGTAETQDGLLEVLPEIRVINSGIEEPDGWKTLPAGVAGTL